LVDGDHGRDGADVQVVAFSIVDEDRDVVAGQEVSHAAEVERVFTGCAIGGRGEVDEDGAVGGEIAFQPGQYGSPGLGDARDLVCVRVNARCERADGAAEGARAGAGKRDDVILENASVGEDQVEAITPRDDGLVDFVCGAVVDDDGDLLAGRDPSEDHVPGRRTHHQRLGGIDGSLDLEVIVDIGDHDVVPADEGPFTTEIRAECAGGTGRHGGAEGGHRGLGHRVVEHVERQLRVGEARDRALDLIGDDIEFRGHCAERNLVAQRPFDIEGHDVSGLKGGTVAVQGVERRPEEAHGVRAAGAHLGAVDRHGDGLPGAHDAPDPLRAQGKDRVAVARHGRHGERRHTAEARHGIRRRRHPTRERGAAQ